MVEKISINGEIFDANKALISVNQRGFLFGDGIFETCQVFAGKILNWKNHQNRIICGLDLLDFADKAEILQRVVNDCQLIVQENSAEENFILRISISRGIGSFGYLPTFESKSLIVVQALLKRDLPEKITLGISDILAPKIVSFANDFTQKAQLDEESEFLTTSHKTSYYQDQQPFVKNLKSSNSIPYILNKIRAKRRGFFDLVMLDSKKSICETSSANIFWIKDGQIYTPTDDLDIICGCTRKVLLDYYSDRISQVRAKIADLAAADEVFITNSANLVILVDELVYFDEVKKDWGCKIFGKENGLKIKQEIFSFLLNFDQKMD